MNDKNWQEAFEQEEKKYHNELQKPNILLVGRTGAGKSSLVNMIFGEETVDVGTGRPITKGFNRVSNEEKDVVIYDSEGYEIDEDEGSEFIEKTIRIIKDKSLHDKEKVHLVWFVIPANSSRVPDFELKLYNELLNTKTPTAVIFSQCDESNEEDLNPMIKRLFKSSNFKTASCSEESPFFTTIDRDLLNSDHGHIFKLDKIVSWSVEKLPEIVKNAFISSQNASLKAKHNRANKIALQHASSNAFVAFSPIPFSDAPILLASQARMLVRILKMYDISGNLVNNIMSSGGSGMIVSKLGKAVVAQVLKFIPGAGTTIGGLINATVAASITYAMGMGTSLLIYNFLEAKINGNLNVNDDFMEYFSANFNSVFESFFNQKMNE